jgi:hypothetical protein
MKAQFLIVFIILIAFEFTLTKLLEKKKIRTEVNNKVSACAGMGVECRPEPDWVKKLNDEEEKKKQESQGIE